MGLDELVPDGDEQKPDEQEEEEEEQPEPGIDKENSNYEPWRGTGESPDCPSCGYGGITTEGHGYRCDNQGCGVVVYLSLTEIDTTKSDVDTPDIDEFLDQYSIPE